MQSYLCIMAVRLLEMRVLKDTGSIYLCDPTAVTVKLLMDSIYSWTCVLNEMSWRR